MPRRRTHRTSRKIAPLRSWPRSARKSLVDSGRMLDINLLRNELASSCRRSTRRHARHRPPSRPSRRNAATCRCARRICSAAQDWPGVQADRPDAAERDATAARCSPKSPLGSSRAGRGRSCPMKCSARYTFLLELPTSRTPARRNRDELANVEVRPQPRQFQAARSTPCGEALGLLDFATAASSGRAFPSCAERSRAAAVGALAQLGMLDIHTASMAIPSAIRPTWLAPTRWSHSAGLPQGRHVGRLAARSAGREALPARPRGCRAEPFGARGDPRSGDAAAQADQRVFAARPAATARTRAA